MRKAILLIGFVVLCGVSAHALPTVPGQVAGCVANAANNCTWANFSGKSASVGDLLYYFAFRTATTAPSAPGSTTNLDTASASSSSFRSGCAVLTSTTPAAITATNATSIFVAIIHNTSATTTANCVTNGVGFHTTAGASGTTSTYTFTGGTLSNTSGSSLVLGAVGSSTAPCTPSSLTKIAANSSTNIFDNDTNGGVSSFTTTTCTGTTGNWKTDTVEFLANPCNVSTYGPFTCVQAVAPAQVASGTSVTATFSTTVTAGDSVVVTATVCGDASCGTNMATAGITATATDTAGDSCAKSPASPQYATSNATANDVMEYAFKCPSVTGGTNNFTVTYTATVDYLTEIASEWYPLGSFDVEAATGNAVAGNSCSATTAATSQSVELVLGFLSSGTLGTITAGASYSILTFVSATDALEGKNVAATGAQTVNWTWATSAKNDCYAHTIEQAASGSPATPRLTLLGVGN